MSNRLTRIYTRTGDKGTTALANGTRVAKTHPRIEALGDVDELNALLGVLLAQLAPNDRLIPVLAPIQHALFDLGGELAVASPEYQVISEELVTELEGCLDELNSEVPPLKEFILPGGNPAAAHCQLARSVCRRAERRCFSLAEAEENSVNPALISYLNRLSDLLFVVARVLTRRTGEEILWQPREQR